MNYAITCILQKLNDFDIHGISQDKLAHEIKKNKPDVLVFELDKNNLKLLENIRSNFPGIKALVLIDIDYIEIVLRLLKYNFEGYLLKGTSEEELINATKRINEGWVYYDKKISESVMTHISGMEAKTNNRIARELSSRELEILECIVLGEKNKDIADELSISENTVLTHRRNIMKKLNVTSTPKLIACALKTGMVDLPKKN